MPSFLNIKIKILQNSLKNIRDTGFNLFTFQTNCLQLYWKGTPTYALFVERRQTSTSEISSKNQIAVPDKFSEAAIRRYFSK